jgi:hypothetical protein
VSGDAPYSRDFHETPSRNLEIDFLQCTESLRSFLPLNFLYALLENESRLSAVAMGLDPGIGVLHVGTPNGDSLVCDLMEVCRPKCDAFLLQGG